MIKLGMELSFGFDPDLIAAGRLGLMLAGISVLSIAKRRLAPVCV